MERDPATVNQSPATPRRASARVEGELTAIFAGGFIGTIARAGLAQALAVRADQWPWATFAVNIASALALGYLVTRLERFPPYTYRHAFLATGICGALSTFSTMMLELLRMIDGAHWGLALGYAAASLAGGFAAVFVASKLVRRAGLTR
ncbi:MAG: fluoride efflux transporter CrcB [Solirubrobacterales bacterium]|nr:fluoride efflux transporter CrcB [Solirubrobacterales bacterium]